MKRSILTRTDDNIPFNSVNPAATRRSLHSATAWNGEGLLFMKATKFLASSSAAILSVRRKRLGRSAEAEAEAESRRSGRAETKARRTKYELKVTDDDKQKEYNGGGISISRHMCDGINHFERERRPSPLFDRNEMVNFLFCSIKFGGLSL